MELKQQIINILQTSPLSISQTRRAGSNGLRNAEEIADKIVAAVKGREERLVSALEKLRVVTCRQPRGCFNTEARWNNFVEAHFEAKKLLKETGGK